MSAIQIKTAKTTFPVLPLIAKRYSTVSFADKSISQQDLNTILEAATWAASANNEQPWLYYYGLKGTSGFDTILQTLARGNQPWAKNAAILLVAVARNTFEKDQKPNATALHDLGLANSNLFLQAVSLDIYPHPMGGFSKEEITKALQLPENQQPVTVIALGYLSESEPTDDALRSRENSPRQRKSIDTISFAI